MDPYNPYSPPAVPIESVRFETMRLAYRPAKGMWTKQIYLAVSVLQFFLGLSMSFGLGPETIQILALLQLVLFAVWVVLICVWIHTAWSDIPPDDRGHTTPGSAVGKLFIPIYNLYWMFAVSRALCDALNARLARIGAPATAPGSLAGPCCALHLVAQFTVRVPGFVAVAPFAALASAGLWFIYMLECDKARMILAQNTFEERSY